MVNPSSLYNPSGVGAGLDNLSIGVKYLGEPAPTGIMVRDYFLKKRAIAFLCGRAISFVWKSDRVFVWEGDRA
jgi:hypothetical protein